jgi:hypothetical protein
MDEKTFEYFSSYLHKEGLSHECFHSDLSPLSLEHFQSSFELYLPAYSLFEQAHELRGVGLDKQFLNDRLLLFVQDFCFGILSPLIKDTPIETIK